uniref:LAM_G_DOMAIN domain-containing protein n=1 Tax=Macrostomum lignano TaxID=282301 RepID=A0A1I8GWM6_9PLAT
DSRCRTSLSAVLIPSPSCHYQRSLFKHEFPTTFNGLGFIYLNVSSQPGLSGRSDAISLQYRTRQLTAFLIYVGKDGSRSADGLPPLMPQDYIAVSLQNGSLALGLSVGGVARSYLILPIAADGSLKPRMFADSRWHRLQVLRQRQTVEVKFDDRVLRTLTVRQSALSSSRIYLGGSSESWMPETARRSIFKGCMR